jgi:hypothetical protein
VTPATTDRNDLMPRLPLGWVQRVVSAARMGNLDEVRAWYQAGAEGTIEVRLEPGDEQKSITIRHVPGGMPTPPAAPDAAQ